MSWGLVLGVGHAGKMLGSVLGGEGFGEVKGEVVGEAVGAGLGGDGVAREGRRVFSRDVAGGDGHVLQAGDAEENGARRAFLAVRAEVGGLGGEEESRAGG